MNKPKKKKIDHSKSDLICNNINSLYGYNQACDEYEAYLKALDERELGEDEIAGIVGKEVCRHPDRISVSGIVEAIIKARELKRGRDEEVYP